MDNLTRFEILQARSDLLRQVRDFFYERQFIEVQTPTLSRDTMVDLAIDPISLKIAGESKSLFLQTSPEFAMKRLLIEGLPRIFEITPAFRNAEFGERHNPEFTMLEWYRAGDDYEQGMKLLSDFATNVLDATDTTAVSYLDLFEKVFSINPHTATLDDLIDICQNEKIDRPEGMDRDDLLQLIMSERIEPKLGRDVPVIVFDWPDSQSALAKLRDTGKGYRVAERFELYVQGIELANGYHELTNPQEQRRRLNHNNSVRQANGLAPLNVDSRLLNEMAEKQLPDSCGVAVGFDRLLMVKLGISTLSDVLVFDIRQA